MLKLFEDFLDLVDKHLDVGIQAEFDCFYEASYAIVESDGVKFSVYSNKSSVEFDIETNTMQYTITYEHAEDDLPSGEKFEEFLRELRKQYDLAVEHAKTE